MILTLTASIMYWSLQQPAEGESEASPHAATSQSPSSDGEDGSITDGFSNMTMDDAASETSSHVENGDAPTQE